MPRKDRFGRRILRLSSRSPLNVEDGATPALAADKPIPLPRVTKPEGASADLPARHRCVAPRTKWRAAGREFITDLLELGRAVLGLIGFIWRRDGRIRWRAGSIVARYHSGIRTTTFPNCWPLASRSNAFRP